MSLRWPIALALSMALLIGGVLVPGVRGGDTAVEIENDAGVAKTINTAGFPVEALGNPFFLDLGVNGRRCVTCHAIEENMTITPAGVAKRFRDTAGTDPLFRTNDGSNSPLADVSTVGARRRAYSMLLRKAVIRVGLPVPESAEFELIAVRDPYGYAGRNANGNELSLFRRPPPTTNLAFLSTVMWDGRETHQKGSAAAIHFDLTVQANGATVVIISHKVGVFRAADKMLAMREGRMELFGPRDAVLARLMKPAEVRAVEAGR